jgi:hypothetical protein
MLHQIYLFALVVVIISMIIETCDAERFQITQDLNGDSIKSPSLGTDISQPIAVINCANQTRCIQPALQLQSVFNVFLCPHIFENRGVRFYYMIREGLILHPNINLVKNPISADYIIYIPMSGNWKHLKDARFAGKIIVLDEADKSDINSKENDPTYAAYFKRSIFSRLPDGRFNGYMNYMSQRKDIYPLTYSITETYVRTKFLSMSNRKHEILCSLRDDNNARSRVKSFLNKYAKFRNLVNVSVGEV